MKKKASETERTSYFRNPACVGWNYPKPERQTVKSLEVEFLEALSDGDRMALQSRLMLPKN